MVNFKDIHVGNTLLHLDTSRRVQVVWLDRYTKELLVRTLGMHILYTADDVRDTFTKVS